MTNLATNKKIAELKGWTNINELGGSLIGTPPAGLHESRGQRLVPDWTGDSAAAFTIWCEIIEFSEEHLRSTIAANWVSRSVEGMIKDFRV